MIAVRWAMVWRSARTRRPAAERERLGKGFGSHPEIRDLGRWRYRGRLVF